jgi:phosphopantothenoylcysteine decarboxylase/phosphopantothenate--cysteine ligase
MASLEGKRVLLVIAGGIAAYKSLELIRRLREKGCAVRCILTRAGAEFVTPLSVAALSGDKVYSELFSLTDESDMGHIQLSRSADLVVVAPATADLMAKMAAGAADDLASTALLATDKRVMIAPAMNVRMWDHAATQANLNTLAARGIRLIGPNEGDMACGEHGPGRMAEPHEILAAVEGFFRDGARLAGRKALVTSGPTHEPIDPVRYIANRSSGKQGHAIAAALADMGAATTLVTGPTAERDPAGVTVARIETAREMLDACCAALPVDVAVCAAAVADWRPGRSATSKIKKTGKAAEPIALTENPDILGTLAAAGNARPRLVVGFAAETDDLEKNARAKLAKKGCDWIVANDVSQGVMGADDNTVRLVTAEGIDAWPTLPKAEVARRLAARIADFLEAGS